MLGENYCPVVNKVAGGSIADELGIKPGDKVISINHKAITDLIDYKYLTSDEYIELEVDSRGERWIYEIEKDFDEDLGITFESSVFDQIKSCHNKCVFCFVDQMPPDMRKTLYIKDDDYRMSFLHGNFVTLTNLKKEDIERIIELKLSPIYISVHATNQAVRRQMLNNKFAGSILDQIKQMTAAGIELHTQIVLVPGINDDSVLEETVSDLASFHPNIRSVAVVPVGVTKYRNQLKDIRTFSADECKKIIEQISHRQNRFLNQLNTRLVYLADEFYLKSNTALPQYDQYENFPQLENGVGLTREFWQEFDSAKSVLEEKSTSLVKDIYLVTGTLGATALKPIENWIELHTNISVKSITVDNSFFGEEVTVSGLVTGQDIIRALRGAAKKTKFNENTVFLIPDIMLRQGERVFLDDLTWEELTSSFSHRFVLVPTHGKSLVEALLAEVEVR